MNLVVAGLSHKTASVEIREKLSFSVCDPKIPLETLVLLPEIYEGIILSTCNRVEIIYATDEVEKSTQAIKKFLADFHHLSVEEITPFLYFYTDQAAIRHVFRVASSLDSMVIGEPQILGQLKDAYRSAVEHKTTGFVLNRFLHKAFSVAKRVRTETEIALNAVSVSFAAVELARKIFDTLEDKKILLIGAGEMAELVTRHLVANGVQELFITNRTFEHALSLANAFGGKAIPFNDYPACLAHVDITITSITASHFLITHEQIDQVLHQRKNKPMFFIDIAVPRNVDPQVHKIANVYLYNIDDLDEIVETNRQAREKEAERAEKIIDEEQVQFFTWLRQQDVTPTIVTLKEKVEKMGRDELEKTVARWEGLSEKEKERLQTLTQAIVNKFLHGPISYLKAGRGQAGLSIEEVKKMFNLHNGDTDDFSQENLDQEE